MIQMFGRGQFLVRWNVSRSQTLADLQAALKSFLERLIVSTSLSLLQLDTVRIPTPITYVPIGTYIYIHLLVYLTTSNIYFRYA